MSTDPFRAHRLLVSNIRDIGILLIVTGGHTVGWGARATNLAGYSPGEPVGLHIERFFTPEDNKCRWPQHVLAMAEAQGRFEDGRWRVRRDGHVKRWRVS